MDRGTDVGGRFAITGATLIDGRGGDTLERAVVVVEDTTIVAVGAGCDVPRDREARSSTRRAPP